MTVEIGADRARVGDGPPVRPAAAAERRREERRRWRHTSLIASVQLPKGRWLNVETRFPRATPAAALPSLIGAGVMAVAICVIVVLMIRRMTRPMAELAAAAERLGRDEAVPPLPERGPEDVRQTTRAFNRMHDRLQRFARACSRRSPMICAPRFSRCACAPSSSTTEPAVSVPLGEPEARRPQSGRECRDLWQARAGIGAAGGLRGLRDH